MLILHTVALFGLVTYPALGLYRSLSAATYQGAQGKIMLAHKNYGEFLAMTQPFEKPAVHSLMEDFEWKVNGR
jgi:sterol 3beta-glucosyltransferase